MEQQRFGISALRFGRARQRARNTLLWVLAVAAVTAELAGHPAARTDDNDSLPALREQPLTQYRAYRRMHARNEKTNQEAWLDAWTEMNGRAFQYDVVSERGSDYIRNKVLRNVLKREQELVTSGECGRSDLTPENYEFRQAPSPAPGERYLILKPKRKDLLLVDGRAVFNPEGTELLRVEGRLAKNPSFWTSLVNVIRHYARIDGVRVPVSTETVAKLKFVGMAQLDVVYEYESINGRPLSLAARRAAAAQSNAR
jgi:hypothetical protein